THRMLFPALHIFISRVCLKLNWMTLPKSALKSVLLSKVPAKVPNRKGFIDHHFIYGWPSNYCVTAKNPCDWQTGIAQQCCYENSGMSGLRETLAQTSVKLHSRRSAVRL